MELKDKLLELRKKNKLSQEQLAEKLNVSRQAISKWEQGVNYPDIANLKVLCEIYHISIDELLAGNKEEAKEDFGKREKECPQCHSFIPLESVFCKNCGYLFKKRKRRFSFLIIVLIVGTLIAGIYYFNFQNEKPNKSSIKTSTLILQDESKQDNEDSLNSTNDNQSSNTSNNSHNESTSSYEQKEYKDTSNVISDGNTNAVDYGDVYSGTSKKYDVVNGYDIDFYSEFNGFNGNVTVQRWHIKKINDTTARFTIYYTSDNQYRIMCFIPPSGDIFTTQGLDINTKVGTHIISIDVPLSMYENYLAFSISFLNPDCRESVCDLPENRGFIYYNRTSY